MTQNQIAYQAYLESVRANKAREAENVRSNLAKEQENIRSHKAQEIIGAINTGAGIVRSAADVAKIVL